MKRMLVLIALAPSIQGCSYGYDVMATVIGGRLAFVSADDAYTCLANVRVNAVNGTTATPEPGDHEGLVLNGGAFWETDGPISDCVSDFPVFYGVVPPGANQLVAPKRLQVGVIYSVNTEGHGAYGFGCFRISESRRVENLPGNPCARPED